MWKEIGDTKDNRGKVILKEYICIHCSAYCKTELMADIKIDYCIDTRKRQLSVITPAGRQYEKV